MDPVYLRSWGRNTQDAWLWKSPIKVPNCDFELGRIGCDHAIAHRFKSVGYIIVNQGSRLKIGHIDQCRGKTAMSTCTFHYELDPDCKNRPASEGWAFVPDIHLVPKLDDLLKQVNMSPLHNYVLASELISTLWEPEPEVLGNLEEDYAQKAAQSSKAACA